MYLGIFQPLETRLAAHTGWAALGIDFDERRRTPALIADIIALGGVVSLAPAADEETLQSFEAALGALYVLEGSTLGGKFILRAIVRNARRPRGRCDAFFRRARRKNGAAMDRVQTGG
jgi:heme oxygenase